MIWLLISDPVPSGPSTQFRVNCSDSQTRCIKTQNLTEFPKDIPQNTTTVELKNGNITTLKKESLAGLTSLKTLILSNNNIKVIIPGAFHGQSKLKYLDLCGNNMTVINGNVWVGLVSLETLQLAGNKFHSLPSDAFSNLPDLKILRIGFSVVMREKEILFDHNTFPNSKKQPQIGLEEDDNFLVCNSSNCWLKEKEEKGLLVHYQKNGRPSRPKCSDKPGLYWDEVDLKCPGKNFISTGKTTPTSVGKTHWFRFDNSVELKDDTDLFSC